VYRRGEGEKLSEKTSSAAAGEAISDTGFDNRERFFRIKVFHTERRQAGSRHFAVQRIFIADHARLHTVIIRTRHRKLSLLRRNFTGVGNNGTAKMNDATVNNGCRISRE
jgi:hypothetical protein